MLQVRARSIHANMITMNSGSISRLHIVVLAAGFSSRLGQSKALARVRGRSLLGRTVKLAQSLEAASIIVVIPPDAARYKTAARGMKVTWAINRRRSEGLSSSVRLGIAAARYASAILFLPVDLANLKHCEVDRLIRRWRPLPRRLAARRIADSGTIPLILPRRLFARALRVAGDIGLRELAAELRGGERALVELASASLDVDTPEALAEARRRSR